MGHYRELKTWQTAHKLALRVCTVVDRFPPSERFELSSQLKRAVLSVPTNIAEGQGRFGAREALRFSRIAAGSLAEVDYLLFFAWERGYLTAGTHKELDGLRKDVNILPTALIRRLSASLRA